MSLRLANIPSTQTASYEEFKKNLLKAVYCTEVIREEVKKGMELPDSSISPRAITPSTIVTSSVTFNATLNKISLYFFIFIETSPSKYEKVASIPLDPQRFSFTCLNPSPSGLVSAATRIDQIKKDLVRGVLDAFTRINEKHGEFTGVCYPEELNKIFVKNDQKMPDEYWSGYANPEYFRKTRHFTFELKEGKSASEAIEVLIRGLSVLDCGNACQLAYYKAILSVIGRERFDTLFCGVPYNLTITQNGLNDLCCPLSLFAGFTKSAMKCLKETLGHRSLNFGDKCHFSGIEYYPIKHPGGGHARGWNVVYCYDSPRGEQLFVGQGLRKAKTEHQINRMLLKGYNRERTPRDEICIQEATSSDIYDSSSHTLLSTQHTIPLEQADTAVGGFLTDYCEELRAEAVLMAATHVIDLRLKITLSVERSLHSNRTKKTYNMHLKRRIKA